MTVGMLEDKGFDNPDDALLLLSGEFADLFKNLTSFTCGAAVFFCLVFPSEQKIDRDI